MTETWPCGCKVITRGFYANWKRICPEHNIECDWCSSIRLGPVTEDHGGERCCDDPHMRGTVPCQFTQHWHPSERHNYPPEPWPLRLNGRPCLITDLPPGHYMTPHGHVLPLVFTPAAPMED